VIYRKKEWGYRAFKRVKHVYRYKNTHELHHRKEQARVINFHTDFREIRYHVTVQTKKPLWITRKSTVGKNADDGVAFLYMVTLIATKLT